MHNVLYMSIDCNQHQPSFAFTHCKHLWINLINPCCHIWYLALKHPISVHHYSSPSRPVLVLFGSDESQLKTALSIARQGRTLWNVAVVLDPQEGWIDENQNQTSLWEKPGGNWGGSWILLSERYALFQKHQLCFAFAALRPAVLAWHTHTHTDA